MLSTLKYDCKSVTVAARTMILVRGQTAHLMCFVQNDSSPLDIENTVGRISFVIRGQGRIPTRGLAHGCAAKWDAHVVSTTACFRRNFCSLRLFEP